jgi:ABC-type hemin transport system substrate-binding protein
MTASAGGRVVSLCPSLTELVFALGCGALLVGRTAWCRRPAGRVEAVERVGGTKTPDVARILALRPALVLMNEEENRREDEAALAAAGLGVHRSLPRDAAGAAAMVRSVAAALSALGGEAAPARGRALADAIEARAAALARDVARERGAGRGPTRFAYLIWRAPWMAAGPDTYASALLELAGGVNVLRDAPELAARYPAIEAARLAALAPDRVLLASEPFPFGAAHAAELARVTGLPPQRLRLVDGERLSWHGVQTPAGLEEAARLMRGA